MNSFLPSPLWVAAVLALFLLPCSAAVIEGPSGGIQAEVIRGSEASVELPLSNTGTDGSQPISISFPSALNWLVVDGANPTAPIAGGQTLTVPLVGTVPESTPLGSISASILVYEEGSVNPVIVTAQITVSPPAPAGAEIGGPAGGLAAEVVPGASVSIDLELSNASASASGPISLVIPSILDWLTVEGAEPIPSIPGGGTATVQLVGTVPESTPLGLVCATLLGFEEGAGTPIVINAKITVVSPAGTGVLEVFVEDEFTFFDPAQPRVEGATVSLIDPLSGQLIGEETSDASGRAEFVDLVAGTYLLRTSAPEHGAEQRSVTVTGGNTQTESVFLVRLAVSYTFSVNPADVVYRNEITVESQFSATALRPQMAIAPGSIDVENLSANGVTTVLINATNFGLVTIENMEIQSIAPPGTTVNVSAPSATLPAHSSAIIPVEVTVNDPDLVMAEGGVRFKYTSGGIGASESHTQTLSFVDSESPPVPPPNETRTIEVGGELEQVVNAQKVGTVYELTIPIVNHSPSPMTNVALTPTILNASDQDRTAGFTVDLTVPSTIPAGGSATLSAVVTPSADVIGASSQVFFLGGTLDYDHDGSSESQMIGGTPFRLEPLPRLALKVFSPLEITADDPLTYEVEPSEPYPVAFMLSNNGSGVARSPRLIAAQPTIDQSNIAASVTQVATAVGNRPLIPSLRADFRDLEPGEVGISRSFLAASLGAKLSQASVTTSVSNSNGGLLPMGDLAFESISTHDAMRVVRDPRPSGVAGPAFLTDENRNGVVRPDSVHLADGTVSQVNRPFPALTKSPSFTNRTAQIDLSGATTGFAYFQLQEPSNGTMPLEGITREDGTPINFEHNVWTTRKLTSAPGAEVRVFAVTLHVFDHNPSGSYALAYGNAPPEVREIEDQVGSEQVPFTLTPEARDTDSDPPIWSLDEGAPSEMSIDSASGMLAWTPDESAGGQTFPITVTATDAHPPFGTDSASFDLMIQEQNSAPEVEPAELTVIGGLKLNYQVMASDPDIPAQNLTFSFPGSSPSGMSLSEGGLIEWKVPDVPMADTVIVAVSGDDGSKSDKVSLQLNIQPFSGFQPTAEFRSLGDGNEAIEAEGLPFHRSEIWTSDNMTTWRRVYESPANADGTLRFDLDPEELIGPRHFFELRFPGD